MKRETLKKNGFRISFEMGNPRQGRAKRTKSSVMNINIASGVVSRRMGWLTFKFMKQKAEDDASR